MLARTYLLRIQRNLYLQQKRYARSLLGVLSPELKKYLAEYQRDFKEFKGFTTKEELLAEVQSAHLTICGDYHTLGQAQRTLIRLLREALPALRAAGRRPILALEMLRRKDTPLVQRYFDGDLGEDAFLKAIRFRKNWGFHWENYRNLLEFARQNGIGVVGLNTDETGRHSSSLIRRDHFAARCLADLTEGDRDAAVFGLIGDLHLAQSHLPRALHAELKKRGLTRGVTVIHQNHEGLYWKLAGRRLQRLGIVRVKDRVFCVLNTPPWVKLQTYLRWAEATAVSSRASESDITTPRTNARNFARFSEALGEAGSDDHDYADEIRELVATLGDFLGLEKPVEDDFKVVWPSDMSFLSRLGREQGLSHFSLKVLAQCLTEYESHFIARANLIYLTGFSLNQAAAQSAVFLHAKVSGHAPVFESPKRDFYPTLWTEALAFVGSKILNPNRKCPGPADLVRWTEAPPPRGGRERVRRAEVALEHLGAERDYISAKRKRFRGVRLPARTAQTSRALFYYGVARILGQILGQALYSALIENQIAREDLRTLFQSKFSPSEAKEKYLYWAKRLDAGGHRKISQSDSL